jgi:hypothetical protein
MICQFTSVRYSDSAKAHGEAYEHNQGMFRVIVLSTKRGYNLKQRKIDQSRFSKQSLTYYIL